MFFSNIKQTSLKLALCVAKKFWRCVNEKKISGIFFGPFSVLMSELLRVFIEAEITILTMQLHISRDIISNAIVQSGELFPM